MTTYRVVWEIDIEAGTPQDAVMFAMKEWDNPVSEFHCFTVEDSDGRRYKLDLLPGQRTDDADVEEV